MKKIVSVCIGFASLALMAQGAAAQEAGQRLPSVVVTATKSEKRIEDVTQSVTVITADDIKRSGATTPAEVIDQSVGVMITDQGGRGSLSTVSIRGSRYAQVLVLLDGKRLNSPRDGGFDLSSLPIALDDIERIEIVRGSSSALFGSEAVGGVINIITKKPQANNSRLAGSMGSHGYDTLSLGFGNNQGGVYYSFSGERQTYDGYRSNSDLDQDTMNGKIGFEFSPVTAFELSSNYLSKELGVPGSLQYPSPNARQNERERVDGALLRTRFGQALDLSLSAQRTQDDLKYKDPQNFVDSLHKSKTDGEEAKLTWIANSWNQFTIGYETRKDRLDSTDSGVHSATLDASYVQDELSLGDSLIVVIGTRRDSHSVYGDKTSPRTSARYFISGTGTIIRASYGESFRGPTFNDLYWSDAWSHGNPNLKPESSKETEGSIEQTFGAGASVKVSGYERNVKDLIDWRFDVFPMRPENIGKALIRGYEGEAKFPLSADTTIAANYAYTNPVDELTGEKIYYTIPKTQLKGILSIALDSATHLSLERRQVVNYVKPGENDWRYTVMDAKISQTFTSKRGELFFGMKNIFDRRYEIARGYLMPPKEIYGGASILF